MISAGQGLVPTSRTGSTSQWAGIGASFRDGLIRVDVAKGSYLRKRCAPLYVEARF